MKTSYIAIVLAAALALATVYFTTMKDTVAPETTAPTATTTQSTTPTVPEAVQDVAQPECTQYSLSNGAWVCTETAVTGD